MGCGRISPKPELVRLALSKDPQGHRRPVLDSSGKMPGRGAYLCRDDSAKMPAAQCLERAVRHGGLARAFRSPVTNPPDLLESVS